MELQLIMDAGSENLGGAMWLSSSLSPTYQQLSPGKPGDCELAVGQHTSLDCQDVQSLLWQDRQISPEASPEHHHRHHQQQEQQRQQQQQQQQQLQQQHHHHFEYQQQHNSQSSYPDSPLSASSSSSEHKLCVGSTSLRSSSLPSQALKRSADDSYRHKQSNEPERKLTRKNGSNNSQGWSSQVEELAEHLVTDFDGTLSVLAASDLATAVASYNMSEALLALPSLTVFKQEALSPENQHTNTLNQHVSQRSINGTASNNESNGLAETDNNNNNAENPTDLQHHQLLYSNTANDEYLSSSGNNVSSSSQSTEINEDCRFQYVLAAATSIATKVNEETLTYLNQGQSYEIKLKKLGDPAAYRGKMLESTIRICFHERRLQYTEREQFYAWQRARLGERLLEVDVPLSYGMLNVCQLSSLNNSVEFTWDPTKEVGCYVKINCISTEFTPKKHGGEKGVPFRIQVETRLAGGPWLHAASCQVKIFKLKGADRKHKQDRDKIKRRPLHEQDKYQCSYDCTILTDLPLDSLSSSNSAGQNVGSPYSSTDVISSQSGGSGSCSPVTTALALSSSTSLVPVASAPVTRIESVKKDVGGSPALPSPVTAVLPDQNFAETEQQVTELRPDANAVQVSSWLRSRGFHAFEATFSSFSALDILRLSRDDLIQICGLADGIRLFNALHVKTLQPELSLYIALDTAGPERSLWRAIYLDSLTLGTLTDKLLRVLGLTSERLHSILILGPKGIHVIVTNDLIANIKDESMFFVEIINGSNNDRYKLLLKPSPH